MKTIGIILLLIWLPFYMSAQTGEQIEIDPVTLLPTGKFVKQPQQLQGLDKMADEADLVFKGQVVSSTRITNAAFQISDMFVHATTFKIISILKGTVSSDFVVFQHYNEWSPGGHGWGGAGPPEPYKFENGQSYLIFAANMAKPGFYYSRPPAITNQPNEFRQLTENQNSIFHTLDPRPLPSLSISNAIWLELNSLLNDKDRTNQIYAIKRLNLMSKTCLASWGHEDCFAREAVLRAVAPFVADADDHIAIHAIGCFQLGGNTGTIFTETDNGIPILSGYSGLNAECVAQVLPYATNLVGIINNSPFPLHRAAAIAALSGTGFSIVSNSLPQWLGDSSELVRAQSVLLLPDFPGEFSDQLLRKLATNSSPKVRSMVANAIGNGKVQQLLPTLMQLFSEPPDSTNSEPSLTTQELQAGTDLWSQDAGDVHACAGYALLKFDVDQVGEILKTNISDKGFGLSFIRKLAPNGAEPYFPLLAKELKAHTADSEQEAAKNGFHWSLSYWLSGNFGWAWDTLFGYVSAQPREALANPQFAPMLDALQIADDPGDARTRSLYAFFLDKGLTERAIELRRGIIRRTEDKNINRESFGFPDKIKAFDEMDKQHSLKPGLDL